jgi:hypothetical protein
VEEAPGCDPGVSGFDSRRSPSARAATRGGSGVTQVCTPGPTALSAGTLRPKAYTTECWQSPADCAPLLRVYTRDPCIVGSNPTHSARSTLATWRNGYATDCNPVLYQFDSGRRLFACPALKVGWHANWKGGRVRLNASVLKTDEGTPSQGSNPCPSAGGTWYSGKPEGPTVALSPTKGVPETSMSSR